MKLDNLLRPLLRTLLLQVVGPQHKTRHRAVYALVGGDPHAARQLERALMTRQLWLRILREADWTCQCCRVRNERNRNPFLPKLQVDHVVAIYAGGRTEPGNLQALCGQCNRRKSVKTRDYRQARRWWQVLLGYGY